MGQVGAQTVSSADLLFPQYEEGVAILKDGTKARAYYNYSTVKKQMQYLDDKGTVMTFGNPQEISVITIAGRVFENTKSNGFLERVPVGDGFYYVDYGAKWISGGKSTGNGHMSQSASSVSYLVDNSGPEAATTTTSSEYWTYSTASTNASPQGAVNGIRVTYNDGMKVIPVYAYFVKINDKFKRFDSTTSLSKALGCCKKELEAFVKKENINFKKPEDVYRMMTTFLANSASESSIYGFTIKDIEGNNFPLSSLKGKKIMIVNVASKCGNTPQYAQLQDLYDKYRHENFIIVGFPANNFGAQEPGTNTEIKEFCSVNYGVTFPMMSKISVKGDDIAPVYKWLTTQAENGVADAEVTWNFQKFLIDEQGHWVKTIAPGTSPRSEEVIAWIEGK
jgi:glutathione peroxidase